MPAQIKEPSQQTQVTDLMGLVDSHCHLDRVNLSVYNQDFQNFVTATLEGGIGHMLCVSIDLESWSAMRSLVADFPQISISVGVHPNDRDRQDPRACELIELAQEPKVVAIGETGLDYFHGKGDLAWQRERFHQHILAAKKSQLPLIIHSRQAKEDTLQIMKEAGAEQAGGVMHCFTEDSEMADLAMDMGFFISFSGIITFKNAAQLRDVVQHVPMNKLLIETDSPYLAPVPFRGKSNQPLYVRQVAQCVAELKGLDVKEVVTQTTENFYRCFPKARRTC
jgi:TatD DNase family protein